MSRQQREALDQLLAQHPHGDKDWALDPETAERLWTISSQLIHA